MGMRFARRLRRRLSARPETPSGAKPSGRVSVRDRSLRVAALAAVVAPIGIVMTTTDDSPVPSSDPITDVSPVVWAGRVFVDRQGVERFLESRGADYDTWAARHPVAASRLEGR
jgi:hypothetical protein